MLSSKQNKSQKSSQVKLITNWQYTEEVPPAFKLLVSLLLQKGNKTGKEEQ